MTDITTDDLNSLDVMAIDEEAEQFLTFTLADENYAVPILRVEEIRGWDHVTRIPNTPAHLCGVLNRRGSIVPVVDLRLRFGMPFQAYTETTVIIVLRVHDGQDRTMGIIVDAVSDAHSLHPDEIKATPQLSAAIETEFINGLADIDEQMVMLLDIDTLLSLEAVG